MAFQLALLFSGILVGTTAKTSVQPTKNPGMSKPQCNVNNNFYAGPHCCKKIEQQLTEIKEAIVALRTNQTGGSYDKVFKNCADVCNSGEKINGVYKIDSDGLGEFEVYCDHKTAGGGWTVFQKRQDGSVDFFRAWDAYKRGFGNLNGEFWHSPLDCKQQQQASCGLGRHSWKYSIC